MSLHAPSLPPVVPPTAVRLAPGLWQVAGSGISHDWDAAAYLVEGARPVLVDCGSPLGVQAVANNVGWLCPERPPVIVGTHGHWDHVGGAAALTRSMGTELCIHPGDAGAVADGDPQRTAAALLYDLPFPAVRPAQLLHDDDELDTGLATIRLLHTPGHTPGSMCVLVTLAGGERVLLAADTLWGGFHPAFGSDAEAWVASLDRLAGLEIDRLSFGHGISHLLGDAHERIIEARRRFGHLYDPWHRPNFRTFRW